MNKLLYLLLFALGFLGFKTNAQTSFPLMAEGFDSHVELAWETPPNSSPSNYKVYRSTDGIGFAEIKTTSSTKLIDFTGHPAGSADTYYYYVSALNGINAEIARTDTVNTSVAELGDEGLLDMVQRYTFRYFWDFAHPVSGMARERNTSGNIVTTGGSGFGILALIVGVERGFITRQEGVDRLLKIVSFLQFADKFHGVFPHWMDGNTGNVIPFGQFDDGGDLVETAFLMQGLLCARRYFSQDNPYENALRQAVTGLWEAVEWDFYRKNNSGILYWHWSPNYAWQMNFPIRGYNEAMMVYLLAIASPTHPVPASLWNTGWASQNYTSGLTWYGYQLLVGPPLGGPLFFAHYSFLGFDPREKKDAYANYFTQNRNHTLINRAYCMANPLQHEGYSDVCWGLTASDDPFGYLAHAPGAGTDNGTISPTAALSSMPYTPDESMAALKHFYREHGERLWGDMGFYDAFNLGQDWFANSYLAIDQGPIICMIENYRTGLLWNCFMADTAIQAALEAIGFSEDITAARDMRPNIDWSAFPNPAGDELIVGLHFQQITPCSLGLYDIHGQECLEITQDGDFPVGKSQLKINLSPLDKGIYFLQIRSGDTMEWKRIVKI
ncbi:MAG: glucoamylase family protein [Saprospiraceae bacterium]|nr:T9SS type A sorting domain-containing protein [Saprospiraceae bacterium]